MLIQYTPISTLTVEQKQRLKNLIKNTILKEHGALQFEGMSLSISEIRGHFPQTESANHKILLG